MKTKITELLGIAYPIFQGGMAWVAEYHLAAAVSEAGALGIIGAGGAPASFVREQIQKTKELTKKPFGVNVMLMNPEADEIAKVIVEEGVKVVTTGAGIRQVYGDVERGRNQGASRGGKRRSGEDDGARGRGRCDR